MSAAHSHSMSGARSLLYHRTAYRLPCRAAILSIQEQYPGSTDTSRQDPSRDSVELLFAAPVKPKGRNPLAGAPAHKQSCITIERLTRLQKVCVWSPPRRACSRTRRYPNDGQFPRSSLAPAPATYNQPCPSVVRVLNIVPALPSPHR